MKITEYLSEGLVLAGADPKDKSDLCEVMVDNLISNSTIKQSRRKIVLEKLMERESLSSTGVGDGIAIPHASGEDIEKMIVSVAQVPDGVDFDSIDNEPVKLAFMIIGSERVPHVHLRLLATIVRACKNKELVNSLMDAKDAETIYQRILEFDNS